MTRRKFWWELRCTQKEYLQAKAKRKLARLAKQELIRQNKLLERKLKYEKLQYGSK